MTTSEKNRQVIHVYLVAEDEHHYFGSIQAMYAHFTHEQLGVASQTLYNTWKNEPYITDMAVIRKGRLIQKKQLNTMTGELKSKIGK